MSFIQCVDLIVSSNRRLPLLLLFLHDGTLDTLGSLRASLKKCVLTTADLASKINSGVVDSLLIVAPTFLWGGLCLVLVLLFSALCRL